MASGLGLTSPSSLSRPLRSFSHTGWSPCLRYRLYDIDIIINRTLVYLGHSSIAITLDRYSHWIPSMGEQTAAAMEAALS
jgi:hypothetical protein